MKKEILFTPGPTNVPPEILMEGAKRTIHHRSGAFADILKSVSVSLKKVLKTDGDVFILTSSGTGAMETAVVNFLSTSDSVLVLNTGAFGRRWADILKAYKVNPDVIEYPWGGTFKIQEVKEKLAQKKYKAVLCQLGETSTGTVNDIEQLGKITGKTLLIVDAVSGLLTEEFRMDEWNVDICVNGSQKGFMMPPGLAFIALKKGILEQAGKNDIPNFYFSLTSAKKYFEKGQTPWTPAINAFYQMKKSIEMIEEEGLENVWARHRTMAEITRKAVKEMGLELFSSAPSNGITAVKVPENIDGTKLLENI